MREPTAFSVPEVSECEHLKVVKHNPYMIAYLLNPSEDVQLAAVSILGDSIKYIKNPSEQVQLAAVKQHPFSIRFIKNPGAEVQIAAMQLDNTIFDRIDQPCWMAKLMAHYD